MPNKFLEGLSSLLDKPHVVDALSVLSGQQDFPVSDNLTVPFGLTFEQGQQLRSSAVGKDIAAAQIAAERQAARAEAEKIAIARRSADLEQRRVEHDIAINNLSDSERLSRQEQSAKDAAEAERTFQAGQQTERLTASSAQAEADRTSRETIANAELASREKIAAEQSAAQQAYYSQSLSLQTQQNAMELQRLKIAQASYEADAARAVNGGRAVSTADTVQKWVSLADETANLTSDPNPDLPTEQVVASQEDRRMIKIGVMTMGYMKGEVPLEAFSFMLPPGLREKFIKYDAAVKSGDIMVIDAYRKEAEAEFRKLASDAAEKAVADSEAAAQAQAQAQQVGQAPTGPPSNSDIMNTTLDAMNIGLSEAAGAIRGAAGSVVKHMKPSGLGSGVMGMTP